MPISYIKQVRLWIIFGKNYGRTKIKTMNDKNIIGISKISNYPNGEIQYRLVVNIHTKKMKEECYDSYILAQKQFDFYKDKKKPVILYIELIEANHPIDNEIVMSYNNDDIDDY